MVPAGSSGRMEERQRRQAPEGLTQPETPALYTLPCWHLSQHPRYSQMAMLGIEPYSPNTLMAAPHWVKKLTQ